MCFCLLPLVLCFAVLQRKEYVTFGHVLLCKLGVSTEAEKCFRDFELKDQDCLDGELRSSGSFKGVIRLEQTLRT